MTGHRRGPKRRLRAGNRALSLQRTSYLYVGLLCCASSIFHRRVQYHALSLCYVLAMRVFDIRASSSILRLPLCQISVSVTPSIAELAREEISHTQSLNHPAYLIHQEPKLLLPNNMLLLAKCLKTCLQLGLNPGTRCGNLHCSPSGGIPSPNATHSQSGVVLRFGRGMFPLALRPRPRWGSSRCSRVRMLKPDFSHNR